MKDADLERWLREAQVRGLIGPRELPSAIDHARELGKVATEGLSASPRALDVGSGGGLPGLVLALDWPTWSWVLLDSYHRAAVFLREAIDGLPLGERATVAEARVEDFARDPAEKGAYGLVIGRSVASLAVMCEYAAPLLEVGGRLVVSQPPDRSGVVSDPVLERLGMRLDRITTEPSAAVFQQVTPCPPQFPRRAGIALKRPLR